MVARMAQQPAFLSGKLLLAMPGMADPRFERAVIALCVHDENGAVGIGIGHKRAGISFRQLLRQLDLDPGDAPDCAVHHGGPVEPGRGFVLHSTDWGGQDTLHVNGDKGELFAMTGTIDILRAIANGSGPKHAILALRYAGWAPGQLETEIQSNGWLHCDADSELIFGQDVEDKYARALRKIGIDPGMLSNEAGHA